MRRVLFFIVNIVFLVGCSREYALENFDLTKARESSEIGFETRKLLNQDGTLAGVFSCVYLNDVYPDNYNNDEYFYVSFYTKDSDIYIDPRVDNEESYAKEIDTTSLDVKLNGKYPKEILQLPKINDFSKLLDIENEWSKNYLVVFSHSENLKLNLETLFQNKKILIKYDKDY